MKTSRCITAVAGVLVFLAPMTSLAVDGVIEINQAKALAGGVTAGDAPGFPVTIGADGSYRLTSDLDLTAESADTSAIDIINSTMVTIDLNGFFIKGPNVSGTGDGIRGQVSHVRIFNGFIERMGNNGVYIVGTADVHDLTVSSNGADGIMIHEGTISNTHSRSNGGIGLYILRGTVSSCFVGYNDGAGIKVNDGVVEHCTSRENDGDGILVGSATVIGNHTSLNGTGQHELHCTYRCAYSLNVFASCARTQILANCVLTDYEILQVPPSSNMCLGQICP